MGAAGNKKPKKAKAGKHEAKYESDELMNSASTKGQKKKLLHNNVPTIFENKIPSTALSHTSIKPI